MEFQFKDDCWCALLERSVMPKDGRLTAAQFTINHLIEANVIQEREDCGKTVKELAELQGQDLRVLAAWIFGRGAGDTAEMLGNLTVMGNEAPGCPECGCLLDIDTDSADGYTWEETRCTNSECDYSYSTEPDWDIMPGGYAFDN